jgi:predicted DNA-binding protein (MmcQ/YjbR family)
MNLDQLRELCLSFAGATEQIQWGDDLLFKVAGKVFAVTPLEPSKLWLCLKADPEEFVELTERPGIIPAPYLARAKWVAIESAQTVSPAEAAALIRKSYELVVAKLPRRARESLVTSKGKRRKPAERGKSKRRRKPHG